MSGHIHCDDDDEDGWTVAKEAEYFVAAASRGFEQYGKFSGQTLFGKVEGFVYFIGVGDHNITHVKIGFTASNPYARMKNLQTGCPHEMRMLGFIVGNRGQEQELHDVLCLERTTGEWFRYTDHVARVIASEMKAELDS